ncbi:MAG: hypothetical protein LDL09_05890 [Calditerrivibrio sp.]|nr:hypothetical protein [Calditerrivibrio sp.]
MNYYKKIFNLIPDMIFIHDNTGLIKNMNNAASVYFKGYSSLSNVIKDARIVNKIYNFHSESCINCGEITMTLLNGKNMEFEISSQIFDAGFGRKLKMTILRNISDVKEIEKQFCIAQKQEAIGAMAVGFAHDFKNILSNIKLYLKLIKQSSSIEQVIAYSGVVEDIIADSNNFVKHVLNIARDRSLELEDVVISELLAEDLEIIERILPRNVTISLTDMARNAVVKIMSSRFTNVIFNLCLNSVDAIGGNQGHIHISTERTEIGGVSFIKITVTDNGPGIPKNIINKVFDNFFTTKKHGSGLGLAMVKLAVKDFGGFVEVESEEGVFTSFKIFLPEVIYGEDK